MELRSSLRRAPSAATPRGMPKSLQQGEVRARGTIWLAW